MGNLLFKSEGMSSKQYKSGYITSIVCFIIGVILFVYGVQEHSALDRLVNNISSDTQRLYLILGIICIAAGGFQIATTNAMNKSKLYVYCDHIEGVSSSQNIPTSKKFDIKYSNITSVNYSTIGVKNQLVISTNHVFL